MINNISISNTLIALYSLYHHYVYCKRSKFFESDFYLRHISYNYKINIKYIADKLYNIISSEISSCIDSQVSITLTGGMDSRVILACLLKAGIKPNCLTFGNQKAKDVYFAKQLAKAFNLSFHNVVSYPPNKDWYYRWVIETIKRDNGNSHLHRAHRTAAIAEHAERYAPQVLFTGHMGGEGIRTFSYN